MGNCLYFMGRRGGGGQILVRCNFERANKKPISSKYPEIYSFPSFHRCEGLKWWVQTFTRF